MENTIVKDGFRFRLSMTGNEYLMLSGNNFEESLEYSRRNKIKNIELNYTNGIDIDAVDFFSDHTYFEKVEILFNTKINLDGLYYLKNLKEVSLLNEKNTDVNLSEFKKLEYAFVFWNADLQISNCFNLKQIVIQEFSEKDCTELLQLKNLEKIEITNSRKLESLNGLQGLIHLKEIELFLLPKLRDFSALSKLKRLTYIYIENCKKIERLDFLQFLKNLTTLKINECKEIVSVKEIAELLKLQEIWIRNTKILDGDVSPLIGRENVYCTNYRGHSHTYQQLELLQSS